MGSDKLGMESHSLGRTALVGREKDNEIVRIQQLVLHKVGCWIFFIIIFFKFL